MIRKKSPLFWGDEKEEIGNKISEEKTVLLNMQRANVEKQQQGFDGARLAATELQVPLTGSGHHHDQMSNPRDSLKIQQSKQSTTQTRVILRVEANDRLVRLTSNQQISLKKIESRRRRRCNHPHHNSCNHHHHRITNQDYDHNHSYHFGNRSHSSNHSSKNLSASPLLMLSLLAGLALALVCQPIGCQHSGSLSPRTDPVGQVSLEPGNLDRSPAAAGEQANGPEIEEPLMAAAATGSKLRATRSHSSLPPDNGAADSEDEQPEPTTRNDDTRDYFGDDDGDSDNDRDANLMSRPFDYHANMPVITKRELGNAIEQASVSVKNLRNFIEANPNSNSNSNSRLNPSSHVAAASMEIGSTGWLANSMFHMAMSDPHLLNQTNQALISEEATRILAKRYKLGRLQTLRGLPLISVDQTNLGKLCPRSARTFNCVPGRYRSLTGHCNNVQNPDWGAAQTPLVRYAPALYLDNVARPVGSASSPLALESGGSSALPTATVAPLKLPSSRAVSMSLYGASWEPAGSTGGEIQSQGQGEGERPKAARQHPHMTTMMSFFGQFVFHDLAYISQFATNERNSLIKCCGLNNNNKPAAHPECMPIEYRNSEQEFCLDYVRSTPAIRAGCNLGARDQLNLVSSYLDGSAIYGSSDGQMRRLRTFTGGRLRSQKWPIDVANGSGGTSVTNNPLGDSAYLELLPQIKVGGGGTSSNSNSNSSDSVWADTAENCRLLAQRKSKRQIIDNSNAENRCFQAGDKRANENIGLTLMHTIWLREHNYVADKLAQLNKHWRDERLFEEARRIVVAELQHITYSEFLSSIVGADIMNRFNLSTQSQGYYQAYDPQLNVGISNELAAAVFPFILSTIPNALERYSDRLESLGTTNLADTFMDASDLTKRNRFGQYLMGMISQSAMEPALGLMPMTLEMEQLAGTTTTTTTTSNLTSGSANLSGLPEIDMVALTIQQGRDHGLRGYLYWRRMCQLKPVVRNWEDLIQVMPANIVKRLRGLYQSVEHLDLYLGLLEFPLQGATLGPTFVCLLARQFFHTKHADRYWYENDLPGTAFAPKQLEQIRQTSLAKVMCRNSKSALSFIQPSPMLASDPYLNAYQYCTNRAMVQLDLSKWRESVNSAQQILDELMMNDLDSHESSLVRGRRLAEENVALISRSLLRAKRQLDSIAYDETVRLRRLRRAAASAGSGKTKQQQAHSKLHAGYRYLPRLKRQTLLLNNQSLIFELATNEVVRSLVRQGKDREQAQSIQNDIRDFLLALESVQLDNLLDNSGGHANLNKFITSSGGNFLTPEQRTRLLQAGDQSLNDDPLGLSVASVATAAVEQRTSSVSANCQDDEKAFPCDHTSPIRTITGWCNNLNNPKFGQSFTAHDRILPNAYEDGLSKPRQLSIILGSQETGQRLPLPSARLISTTMHDDKSHLHTRYSLALMQFGQFGVDHDLTRTPFSVALDGSLLDCSPCDSRRTVHRDCLPIEIPDDDAHFNSLRARELTGNSRKCLHFVRSLNGQTGLGPRQQINALTAYFDASNIYGSDNCEAKSLRAFSGGRLNSSIYPTNVASAQKQPKEILPLTKANPECVTPGNLCFHAGDQRASEQPGLTAIHTIFMRLHNSIVRELALINKHWNDEKLYQQGRRIVGAIMQRITYNEFAPRLLGLDYMSKFDLLLKNVGYSDNNYDETCSANILTEFAAAAFRMGHSLIRNAFPLLNKQYKPIGKAFQLRKAFFNSQRILTEPNLIDSILRGVVTTPIETLDNSITEELTNHLFERPKEPFSGMDLISLNIQRARDHGIAGYNKYRAKCNLTRARNFDDLAGEIPAKLIKRLSSLYASVEDIDLFTGGMSELPVHGGIIGPTLGCIIGMQFSRLKRCDRFWHETSDPWVRFSAAQLAEIRKMTLAKVICQESDNIDAIQRNAMDVSDHYLNPRVACSNLPTMDFSAWRENLKSCVINKIKFDLGQTKRVNPCKSCTCTMEGPVCRTAKINCLQVMKRANLSNIMADKSCLVQCAWALDMQQLA